MSRKLPVVFLMLSLAGCQPPTPTTPPTATPAPSTTPPTGQPPATNPAPTKPADPVARKSLTRDELKKWLQSSTTGATGWSTDDVKAKLGKPDTTAERKVGNQNAVVWEYRGLTVDAAGSGKVDSVTRIVFVSGYTSATRTEYEQ